MRVRVFNPTTRDQRANLDQLGNNGIVGLALFALAVKDLKTCKKRHEILKGGVFIDVMGHPIRPATFHESLVIVGPVAGRGVNKAGSGLVGDVITVDHRHLIGPKRISIGKRVLADQAA